MAEKVVIRCEICGERFSRKFTLKRHYENQHGTLPASFNDVKLALEKCRHCLTNVPNAHIARHENSCKAKKAIDSVENQKTSTKARRQPPSPLRRPDRDQPPPPPSPTVQNPPSSPLLDSNEPALEDDGHFLRGFREWCLEINGLTQNTTQQYIARLNNFEQFQRSNHPARNDFSLDSVGRIHCARKELVLPTHTEWVKTFPSWRSRQGAIVAYLKLCDYLHSILSDKWLWYLGEQELQTRFNRIIVFRTNAQAYLKVINKQIGTEMSDNRKDREMQAEDDMDREVPHDVLKKYIKVYTNHPERQKYYDKFGTIDDKDIERMKFEIRNWLMMDLLFEGRGLRPDAILNLTMYEITHGEEKTDPKSGKKFIVYSVRNHKTTKNAGAVQIVVPLALHEAIIHYVNDIRPQIPSKAQRQNFAELDDNARVFMTNNNTPIEKLTAAVEFFARIVDSKFKIWPYSFRRYYATEGFTHEDPQMQKETAMRMAHDPKTAEKYYIDKKSRSDIAMRNVLELAEEQSDMHIAPVEGEVVEKLKEQTEEKRKEKIEEKEKKKEASFMPLGRRIFSDSERQMIEQLFHNVKKDNLPWDEVEKAFDKDQEFRQMVLTKAQQQNKTEHDVFVQVQNSFRAMRRKK